MVNLKDYGWNVEYGYLEHSQFIPARVTEVHRERYKVICEFGEINARLKGKLYNKIEYGENIPVVGDFVLLHYNNSGDSQIAKICERKSKFSRTDLSGHAEGYVKTVRQQVIAANFDYVFILVSLNHDFNIKRIERYIGVALQSGAEPVLILSKADINKEYQTYVMNVQQLFPEIKVFAVSAKTGFGLTEVNTYLEVGKTIVFLGSSGVGKSSLVNAIAGSEIMKVSEIRDEDSKGRHTTTHRQLIMLPTKTMIIDTPGMRELGLWDAEEGLNEAFSDIHDLIHSCRFSDCSHSNEPGCAINEALRTGELNQERWDHYCQLMVENAWGIHKSAYTKQEKLRSKIVASNKKNGE